VVRCRGRANVYQKAGRLQMIVASMIPAGAGLLQKKFLELKAKLDGEGLFASERKRSLPFLPRAIGLVTSGEGAAVHDVMVRLRERMPQIPVYLVDVRVQGPGAAQDIAEGLRFIAESGLVDVIICGRGGGSLEDLWAFNEELVVRAIFGSRVPVVSAVGHEVDVTLADLVADVRAPTPTAAAEMVVPRRTDLLEQIEDLSRRLEDYQVWFAPLGQRVDDLVEELEGGLATVIGNSRLRLAAVAAKVDALEPRHLLGSLAGKIDLLRERLGTAALRDLNVARNRIDRLCASLRQASPEQKVSVSREFVKRLEASLVSAFRHRMHTQRQHLQNLACRFEAASPQTVLRRGFSIVTKGSELIKSVQQVAVADELHLTFTDGGVSASVLPPGAGPRG